MNGKAAELMNGWRFKCTNGHIYRWINELINECKIKLVARVQEGDVKVKLNLI